MRRCSRCAEHNHDDARYCATCGQPMPIAGGIESLLADGPRDGETNPPTTTSPVRTVEDPTTVMHHRAAIASSPVAPDPSSTQSSSVMIAALAVAAVVIIGGVFLLLASGDGDTDVARTGEDPSSVTVPLDTRVTESAAPGTFDAGSTAVPSTAAALETAPTVASPVPTALPTASSAPTTPTTASPEPTPSPTPAPTAPGPSRGAGDLGLTQPILDESCDGRYITFVGSAVGDRPYVTAVTELLDRYPDTGYIWTKSCPSLRQEFTGGADIYGVVFGPFATQEAACDARASGPDDAYVRRISTVDPPDHTIPC